ncbi:nuclear transport factor 2 family protein [Lentiprolixibacter aurantiacus]|uniref:Nuclear transport factor 2 family protein n=1 Tax=Lentiprolixibacter aurantiacus TaxID=2993939 RepID=A0AAE3SMR7_9FLAO|nr:nuclear transport factor 2 family protein [Lentiprolixibacter aurantiacus]MCX2718859.1 nuclear transport factor 2 family protein [Lentiprolixibacter aurantiacus]
MEFCNLGERYLEALQKGELQEILELFAPDAKVDSPVYGRLGANEFYTSLLADTRSSELQLHQCICDREATKLAVYFTYNWTLKDGSRLVFDVVDIMVLDSYHKISELIIVYNNSETLGKITSLRQQS